MSRVVPVTVLFGGNEGHLDMAVRAISSKLIQQSIARQELQQSDLGHSKDVSEAHFVNRRRVEGVVWLHSKDILHCLGCHLFGEIEG